jgi:hypothetical protein
MGTDLPPVLGEEEGDATLPVEPTDPATEGVDGTMSILPVGDLETAVRLGSEATGSAELEEPLASASITGAEAVGTAAEVAAPTSAY